MITRGKYPNTFYRVSLKAIIRNDKGEVLLVKEKGSSWSLPGGGIDHGESDSEALARELYEEVGYKGEFSAKPAGVTTIFVQEKDAWLLWIVYEVTVRTRQFSIGSDADEIAFVNPYDFKNSKWRSEQLVYKMCVDPGAVVTY